MRANRYKLDIAELVFQCVDKTAVSGVQIERKVEALFSFGDLRVALRQLVTRCGNRGVERLFEFLSVGGSSANRRQPIARRARRGIGFGLAAAFEMEMGTIAERTRHDTRCFTL